MIWVGREVNVSHDVPINIEFMKDGVRRVVGDLGRTSRESTSFGKEVNGQSGWRGCCKSIKLILHGWITVEDWLLQEAGIVIDETKVIEELCSRGSLGSMGVPGFIENCMVGCFCNTTVEINVANVVISSTVAQENTAEVMFIQLSTSVAGTLDTDSGTEKFQSAQVGFDSVPSFKWGALESGMDAAVMKVDRVDHCCRPVLCREA